MKKLIFTFLPLVAAVLFATTSCNKDDGDNEEVAQNKTVTVTFTASVGESAGLSKITSGRGANGFTFSWNDSETITASIGNVTKTEKKDNSNLEITVEGLPENWASVVFTVGETELGAGDVIMNDLSDTDLGNVKRTATASKNDDGTISGCVFLFPYAVVYNSASTTQQFYYGDPATEVTVAGGKVCLVAAGTLIGKSAEAVTTETIPATSYVLK